MLFMSCQVLTSLAVYYSTQIDEMPMNGEFWDLSTKLDIFSHHTSCRPHSLSGTLFHDEFINYTITAYLIEESKTSGYEIKAMVLLLSGGKGLCTQIGKLLNHIHFSSSSNKFAS
jgi:hypothetical protein